MATIERNLKRVRKHALNVTRSANHMIIIDQVDPEIALRRAIDDELEDEALSDDETDLVTWMIKQTPDSWYGCLYSLRA